MGSGLQGLRAARQRYDSASERLNSSPLSVSGDAATVSISDEAKALAASSSDVAAARADMKQARVAALANAATIVTADAMMEEVLEIGSPRRVYRDRETHEYVRPGDRARADFMSFVRNSFAA